MTGVRARRGKVQQLGLPDIVGWGGRRAGAGRKASAGRRNVPHRARPMHCSRYPLHVVMRSGFRPLRSQHVFPTLRGAIRDVTRRWERRFRVVQFSVQQDHVHLLVEAVDKGSLSSGLRALAVCIARRVNELVSRRGRFWADRWFARTLESPRSVRHALVYVLFNARKHEPVPSTGLDPYSSARYFDGFTERTRSAALDRRERCPVSDPQSWLLRVGWRRHGLIPIDARPRHPRSAGRAERGPAR